jgi:hypothetical protein
VDKSVNKINELITLYYQIIKDAKRQIRKSHIGALLADFIFLSTLDLETHSAQFLRENTPVSPMDC